MFLYFFYYFFLSEILTSEAQKQKHLWCIETMPGKQGFSSSGQFISVWALYFSTPEEKVINAGTQMLPFHWLIFSDIYFSKYHDVLYWSLYILINISATFLSH